MPNSSVVKLAQILETRKLIKNTGVIILKLFSIGDHLEQKN